MSHAEGPARPPHPAVPPGPAGAAGRCPGGNAVSPCPAGDLMGERPLLRSRPGRPLPGWRFRLMVARNYWGGWRLRHPLRKSRLQREYERGDPDGIVAAEAARITAGLAGGGG